MWLAGLVQGNEFSGTTLMRLPEFIPLGPQVLVRLDRIDLQFANTEADGRGDTYEF